MRLSQLLITTLREVPADAEVPSHRLLARGGYIVKTAAGLYTYAPLLWRTLRKISQIVREELDREGAQELMMPMLHPKELWVSSGRWERYIADGIMFALKDRKQSELCLGPTHEEVITDFANTQISSYKQLPVNLYQIQDKFRDEIRPRFGIMRGREFIMMDAYSFDADSAGLDESYVKMDRAYRRSFERCGLEFTVVQADAGAIGGSGSEEFMVIADTGEDEILYCSRGDACGYAANVEKATAGPGEVVDNGTPQAMEKVATPDVRTVDQLHEFFSLPPQKMAKTLLYHVTHADREEVVAAMLRGDHQLNEVKLANVLDCLACRPADEKEIARATGAEVGFAGPVNLPDEIRLFADSALEGMTNLLCGCNETGFHCLHVNPGRDCRAPEFRDLRLVQPGEPCPRCGSELKRARGIEVGHIFKLGTKYSAPMGATFMSKDGKPQPFVMGCYGIGISRIAAAAVEQSHDEKGIIWPAPIAPFEVVVAVLDPKREAQVALGERLYGELREAGVDVCLDDRALSPGAKFKDLDLLGFPVQVVVGRKADEGVVEYLVRGQGDKRDLPADTALAAVQSALGR